MSRRTEHFQDVIINQEDATIIQDEDEERFDESELDPESWQDWHSQSLLNAYYDLEHSCIRSGLKFSATYSQFCNFMYAYNK